MPLYFFDLHKIWRLFSLYGVSNQKKKKKKITNNFINYISNVSYWIDPFLRRIPLILLSVIISLCSCNNCFKKPCLSKPNQKKLPQWWKSNTKAPYLNKPFGSRFCGAVKNLFTLLPSHRIRHGGSLSFMDKASRIRYSF